MGVSAPPGPEQALSGVRDVGAERMQACDAHWWSGEVHPGGTGAVRQSALLLL